MAVILTTRVVNILQMLMGATLLRPWLRHLSALKAYGPVFFMADESRTLTAVAA